MGGGVSRGVNGGMNEGNYVLEDTQLRHSGTAAAPAWGGGVNKVWTDVRPEVKVLRCGCWGVGVQVWVCRCWRGIGTARTAAPAASD